MAVPVAVPDKLTEALLASFDDELEREGDGERL